MPHQKDPPTSHEQIVLTPSLPLSSSERGQSNSCWLCWPIDDRSHIRFIVWLHSWVVGGSYCMILYPSGTKLCWSSIPSISPRCRCQKVGETTVALNRQARLLGGAQPKQSKAKQSNETKRTNGVKNFTKERSCVHSFGSAVPCAATTTSQELRCAVLGVGHILALGRVKREC